jgi:hypothetical protein
MVAGIASFNVAIDNSGKLTTHFSRPLDSISPMLVYCIAGWVLLACGG